MDIKDTNYYFEIKPTNRLGINLKELYSYRELFYFFAWRDIKIKYKQTVLGFLWAILQPFIMMIILTVIVKGALKIPSSDIPYPIFAFSGFLLWTVFSSGINSASNSMILTNANIIKKIYFPRIIIPVSAIMVSLFDFFMGFIGFIFLLFFFRQPVDLLQAVLYWPVSLIIVFISTLGPGCLLAALNVKYRDFRHIVPFAVQMLLFLTPVIYPISSAKHEWVKYCIALNPMHCALTLFRAPLVSTELDWTLLCISAVSGSVFLWIGLTYFKRTEIYFADFA